MLIKNNKRCHYWASAIRSAATDLLPFGDNQRFESQQVVCGIHTLMKASHLHDGSEDGARPRCYQRDPNDLWELKHRHSPPLHKLPLISLCSPQALGYPATWLSPVDVLVRATAAEEMDMKTGNTGKKDAEGRECLKWDGDEETWKWKVKTLKGPVRNHSLTASAPTNVKMQAPTTCGGSRAGKCVRTWDEEERGEKGKTTSQSGESGVGTPGQMTHFIDIRSGGGGKCATCSTQCLNKVLLLLVYYFLFHELKRHRYGIQETRPTRVHEGKHTDEPEPIIQTSVEVFYSPQMLVYFLTPQLF
ncbi:hypothetical protein F2P81_004397 [Scophthalmus maximus]|uniref:Uncharacterized protein n=1 Tax=Scophthalmus maximus TaxID=52904 RepID=A0A6A4TH17_SCOMX|nr:hypothetical protein F2P81_004397 [Scophthalmus maximus]